jgi:sarcosine oxidase subunit beta
LKGKASAAIIGGGIVGASVAYNLASGGVRDTVVLEKSRAGGGSTTASLGGFRHQFSAELSVRLSQRSVGLIEKFEELTGYDPLVSRDGYVFVASALASFEQLRKDYELQRRLGVPVELLGQEELQESYPFYRFDSILGGTRCKEDGHASTMAVLQGYIRAAKRLGVELYEDTEVVGIDRKAHGGFVLRTSRGPLYSDSVVIAAGAFSGLVGRLASVEIPIKPYPRKVLVTHSFSDGIPHRIPLIVDIDSTFAFGREGKGLVLGTNPPVASSFDLVFPPDYDESVMRAAFERVPATKRCSLAYANSGLYEMTPDSNPVVCEMPGARGLYCCAGFAGHGFMHAPAVGELVAELIMRGKTTLDLSSYSVERFAEAQAETERRII